VHASKRLSQSIGNAFLVELLGISRVVGMGFGGERQSSEKVLVAARPYGKGQSGRKCYEDNKEPGEDMGLNHMVACCLIKMRLI
jgi:hypothetical protein